jgi:hypothetical protein
MSNDKQTVEEYEQQLMGKYSYLFQEETSNEKQITAVEELVEKVESISNDKSLTKEESIRLYNQAIKKAKEIEKKQKADTWNSAINAVEKDKWESFEQYYNETYGGDKRTTTNKITLTGKNNSVLLTDISNTITINCKFQPIETYQNIGSSENSPCVKCGKKLWEHPIKTYGGNK